MPGLIVICGSTATGKSQQALRLAQHLGSVLISADSRQIYRDFDIGTAKPTPAQQALWPHHLIDIADPTETYTVAQYQAQAQALIEQAHQQNQTPILVGGSGLYIQAVTSGLSIPAVPPQPQIREQLETLSQTVRHQILQQVDPVGAIKIHPNDQVRTLRSLEVYYVTGTPHSQLQTGSVPAYSILTLGITCPMPQLEARIAKRTQVMLDQGWVDEVRVLRGKYGSDLPLLNTLGYSEIGQALDRTLDWELMPAKIVQHTRQFAKRQNTWFRRMTEIKWFDCEAPDLDQQIDHSVDDFLGSVPS